MSKYSDVYSITIRTGNGVDLGSPAIPKLIADLREDAKHLVLNVEKTGDAAHIQGSIFLNHPMKLCDIQKLVMPYAIRMYKDNSSGPISVKQLENVRKYSVKIVPHTNYHILTKYCMKELVESYVLCEDPTTLLHYEYSIKLWDLLSEIYFDSLPKNVDF